MNTPLFIMKNARVIQTLTYQITFLGEIDDSWQKWFGDFEISCEKEAGCTTRTTLTGEVVDQAALWGILNKIWNLNLVLESVNLVVEDN
jgi:hypothetical protein